MTTAPTTLAGKRGAADTTARRRQRVTSALWGQSIGPHAFPGTSCFTSFARAPERRRWDLNPRWVAPHTISSRADSAALALLLVREPGYRLSVGCPGGLTSGFRRARRRARRPGPAQRPPVNRVRVGRQQLSAGEAVCRSQPG